MVHVDVFVSLEGNLILRKTFHFDVLLRLAIHFSYFAFREYFANVFVKRTNEIRNTHYTLFVFHTNFVFY